jgi:uncharacterized protein YegL
MKQNGVKGRQGLILCILVFHCLLLATACGNEADFAGKTIPQSAEALPEPVVEATPTLEPPEPSPEPTSPPVPDPEPSSHSLTGSWMCEQAPDIEVNGKTLKSVTDGVYEVKLAEIDDVNLSINGQLCSPTDAVRDIVFVVDISGSMATNDPIQNNTCGRRDAIEAVVTALGSNADARVGLVTFGTTVMQSTPDFMKPADFLSSNYFSTNVTCYNGGGTNYSAGLSEVKTILSASRQEAKREIYMISDGHPTLGDGLLEASDLKDSSQFDATIATLMLKGVDTVLKQIATMTAEGKLLHAVTETRDQLVSLLTDLAKSQIDKAELVMEEVSGSLQTLSLEVMDDLSFTTSIEGINPKDYPSGVTFALVYTDDRGKVYQQDQISLIWKIKQKDNDDDQGDDD